MRGRDWVGLEWLVSVKCGASVLLREWLIDQGLCVRQDGRTPLDFAIEKRQDAVAALLTYVRGPLAS